MSTLAAVALGLSLALSVGVAARAAGDPARTPTPAPSLGRPGPDPVAPTIRDVGDRDTNTVVVGGTGSAGATVRVLDPRVPSRALCEVTVPPGDATSASWSCPVVLENGADQTLTVRDVTNSAVVEDAVSAPFSLLGPPAVEGGPAVGGKITGTAFPGARVAVDGGAAPVSATADGTGAWSVVLPSTTWPTGRYTVTASQSSDSVPAVPRSATSTGVVVTIDRDAPAAPVVTAPRAGERVTTQPLTFSGSGEDGATVTAYVDSAPVCQATVSGGAWRCTSSDAALSAGVHVVQAAQIDASANVGPPSAGISVTVASLAAGPAPPSASAAPIPGPGATGDPAVPAEPPAEGSAAPVPGDGSGGTSGDEGGGQTDSTTPVTGNWAAATTFGRDLPTLGQAMTGTGLLLALGLAAAFVLLVVAPSRLLATALSGRPTPRGPRLTGRNRRRELPTSFSTATLDPRVAAALTVAAGAAVVGLAAGLDDEVRSARLFAGIVIGVALVNLLTVVVPTLLVARSRGREARVRMSPRLLLVAVVACAVTRLLGLDPPLVLGVVLVGGIVAAPASTAPRGRRNESDDPREAGILALAQVAVLAVVAAGAWAVHGALPATGGFVTELALETTATICLTGLGSLVLALVPVGTLPGRIIWDWSRPLHVALTVVGVAAAAAVLTGGPSSFPVGGVFLAATLTAGLCVAVWLWTSFVEGDTDEA
ncbi:hypothetical protein [Frigoribacterium sp. VKM Ac-2836]|uniref:hypothetical protein n=1 Tax=Frigoribacterium sp. VKM Ac-2836 TaxID=2739014 RepID=UPI0015649ADD|nr:hypothetical protein [Frigoribacterium sp. VKM Ac-2836]NRD27067.1 hypothetical protein [Frigoribacterium sp. VKM Ac-2836]